METDISDDYNELLHQYKTLKKEFSGTKQNLYDTSRQLKVQEALISEYQSDIDLLQNKEHSQNEKFEAKIAALEDTIATLRSNYSESTSYLENEILEKERENLNFKNEIEILKRKNLVDDKDFSVNSSGISNLTCENELLNEKVQELQGALEILQEQHTKLEEILEGYKEELSEVKENLKLKREELSDKAVLIDNLNDELMCTNSELEKYKQTTLDAASKGNSLFAEVDDRRVYLQGTIDKMKSEYIRLKQENCQHVNLISQLRKENFDFRETWKKDLEATQEDKYWINDTLKRRIKVLEDLLESQKKQLEAQSVPDVYTTDFHEFYHRMFDDKSKEVEKWKKKCFDKSVNEHLLSVNLAETNQKLRILKLEFQQQSEELKEARLQWDTAKDEFLCHKCQTYQDHEKKNKIAEKPMSNTTVRIPIKSCLKPLETTPENDMTLVLKDTDVNKKKNFNIFNNSDMPYTVTNRRKTEAHPYDIPKEYICASTGAGIVKEDVTLLRDKENIDSGIESTTTDKKKEGVTFSANTVDPVGNVARRRGTRIFIAKKKSDVSVTETVKNDTLLTYNVD